jgi:hypothetical protein
VPLAVGNSWIYVDSAYYGGDSVTVDSSILAITGKRAVTFMGQQDTIHLMNALRRLDEAPRSAFEYVMNGAHGLYTRGYAQDTAEILDNVLHVKHPATAGERYPTRFLGFATVNGALIPLIDTVEIEVVNPDTTCAVPAGTFPCVQYRGWRPGGVLHATAYYAPGIGFVGSEIVRTREVNGAPREVVFTRRLASYTLH